MKIETLKDLRDFLNQLNEEQLNQTAGVTIVDSHFERIKDAEITKEDYYIDDSIGIAPVSLFKPIDEDDKLENYKIIKAGHVYIYNE